MICDSCKKDKLVSDFINNNKCCYRCEYQKRSQKIHENKMKKKLKCRMCNKEFFHKEGLKKRQRDVFCSKECAEAGHKDLIKNHWTRQVKTMGGKNGF